MMQPYYEHSGITIYHGDCREIMPHIGKVDAVVTDPPYGIDLGNHQSAKETRPGWLKKQSYASYDDTLENLCNIIVPAVEMAIGISNRAMVFCIPSNIKHFPKPQAVGGVYMPAAMGRCAWGFGSLSTILLYGSAPALHLGAKSTVLVSTESAPKLDHPCPKPLGWMKWCVDLGSLPGETVIDPFAGSGTTLIAAKELGRNAIGIDIDERSCEIAAQRLAQEVLQFPEFTPVTQ